VPRRYPSDAPANLVATLKEPDREASGDRSPSSLHDLRHAHTTLAPQAGIHPKVVSERLGHATVSITLDTYSHAIQAMQEEATALIAELVFAE
jgi:integrase